MTATVDEINDGLKANLATISGLRTYDHVPDTFGTPCAVVMFSSVDYANAFRQGNPRYEFTITLIVGRASERAAQIALGEYLSDTGAKSIRAAVESDSRLNSKAQDLIVQRATNMRMLQQGDAAYLAVDFDVLVHA
jgi:hypothetical protein